ncbi:hypothetical protein CH263_06400 [Rhodococcus sp. 06-1059B-a]|nr:DUF4192 domain-containing protein [Rhodococcus sp. 06-1059B-a]OZD70545.1 hypothetical protein CH263_06400 [Rhodococcus sp. 06-1059B-a]
MTNRDKSTTRIGSTAGLLAAIPAMLGFNPENSIVTIFLGEDRNRTTSIRAIVRSNVADGEAAAADVAHAARTNNIASAMIVAIAEAERSAHAIECISAFHRELEKVGVTVERTFHTYALVAGGPFADLETATVGNLHDPASTEMSALTVLEGRSIETSRDVIEQRFAERTEIPESVGLGAAAALGEDFLSKTFEELAAVVYAREAPSDDLIARVGITLSGSPLDVRDSYLRLAVYGEEHAVEALTHIAGALRGTARAQALTLASFFAYLANHGPAAGIALDAAREAARTAGVDTPSFAHLLDRALRAGIAPTELRVLVPDAEFVRERTGARLPG